MDKNLLSSITRLFIFFLFLFLAGTTAYYTLGPYVLERIIISQMRSAGLENPGVSVVALTSNSLHLNRISAEKPRIHIDSATIDFSLARLIRGRVDRISLSGLKYRVSVEENRLDLGLPVSKHGSVTKSPAVPFDLLEANSCFLVLTYQEKDYLIPFSSVINSPDGQVLEIAAWTQFLGLPLFIAGQSNIQTLETRISASTLLSNFFGPGHGFHDHFKSTAAGPGSLEAELSLDFCRDAAGNIFGGILIEARAGELSIDTPELNIGLEQGSLALMAEFDGQMTFDLLDADILITRLNLNDLTLDEMVFEMRENGSDLDFSARFNSPFTFWINAQGKQTSINQLLKQGLDYRAELDWQAGMKIDPGRSDLVVPVELRTANPVTASVQGGLKAGYSSEPGNHQDRWFLRAGASSSGLNAIDLFLPGYDLLLNDLDLQVDLFIEAGPGLLKAGLHDTSRIRIRQAVLEVNQEKHLIKNLDFSGRPGVPFAAYQAKDDELETISWVAEQKKHYEARVQGINMQGHRMDLRGSLFLNGPDIKKADIRFTPDISRIWLSEPEIEIINLSLDVPFALGLQDTDPGRFSIEKLSYSGIEIDGPSGRIMINNYLLTAFGDWPFLPGADMEFSAGIMLDPKKPARGKVSARSGWFDFPDQEVIDKLIPGAHNIELTGSARTELDLSFNGPLFEPLAGIEFKDVRAADQAMDFEAKGVSGSVLLDSFFPLSTPGNQRVDINSLKIGDLKLENGFAVFRIETPESLFLEKTRWNLPEGGFIAAHAARVDLQESSVDLEFFFEDIDLLKIVSRFSEEKIVGSGLVYGRVPLQFRDERIIIGQGYLNSVPGVGRLGIKDEEWLETLLLYVRDAMSGHPYLSTVTDRLEEALKDFEYDFLSVRLKPGLEDTSARIEIRGKGVRGDPPQEVGSLVINVNDLGEIINRVLRFQLTREESIERALDELFIF